MEILSAVCPLDRQHQSCPIRELVKQSAVPLENILVPIESLVLWDAARKVVALVVKVQLQLQVLHEIHFKTDGREMMDIGRVVVELNLVAAFS